MNLQEFAALRNLDSKQARHLAIQVLDTIPMDELSEEEVQKLDAGLVEASKEFLEPEQKALVEASSNTLEEQERKAVQRFVGSDTLKANADRYYESHRAYMQALVEQFREADHLENELLFQIEQRTYDKLSAMNHRRTAAIANEKHHQDARSIVSRFIDSINELL